MYRDIKVKRISAGSMLKLIAIGLYLSIVPLSLLVGVLSLFGIGRVMWNGRPLYGLTALIASPFVGVFLATMLTAIVWAGCSFGLWVFSKYRPIVLELQEADLPGSER
ncbi:hypothetical protein [Ralstonia flatus]|uniref:Transmembrane protein n=1 Tax=Ralstonia flatus TaxID=3058601 RepID=A0AAD2F755_9RALS|nr:hypothetical protein [Ralstonia sp. LMG 32965]MBN6208263.1 hypothetical protein [Ralstonia pickettii]CAJ0894291.1 hypothetical protein R77567_04515 [Ralstonia sp. LMG 32965]CAJ0903750.1 hypothetical protein R77564_04961 [Ralstonia sp. LMG 32965]